MAAIRKRHTGNWEVQVRRRGYAVQTATFDTRKEAEDWAKIVEGDMARGRFMSLAEAERTSLAEALARYGREVTPRKAQAYRELQTIARLQRHPLGLRPLALIRSKDVADFVAEREREGVGGNTIRLDLALLSHLFEIAANDWGMEALTNPVRRVKRRPKLPPGRDRRLQRDEEEKLTKVASRKLAPVIRFALETAMRRSEIAGLHWEHIDLVRKTAHLPQTKTGEPRTVPLSPRAIEILRSLPHRIDSRVFGMTGLSITHAFEDACKRAGIANLTFHDLRHEATSRLFERGWNTMEVSAVTGHKTLQMLKRYTHLRVEDLAAKLAQKPA